MLTFVPGRVLLTYRDFDLDVVKEGEAPADANADFEDEPTIEIPRLTSAALKALVLALFITLTGCLTDPEDLDAPPPPTLTAPSLDDDASNTGMLDDEPDLEKADPSELDRAD